MKRWNNGAVSKSLGRILCSVAVCSLLFYANSSFAKLHKARSGHGGRSGRIFTMRSRTAAQNIVEAKQLGAAAIKNNDINMFNRAKDKFGSAFKILNDLADSGSCQSPDIQKKIKEYQQIAAKAKAILYSKADALLTKSLADKKLDKDLYTGSDKAELKEKIKKEWMKQWPKDKILAITFPSNTWRRVKNKRWNSAIRKWQYTDTSSLLAHVVVQVTDKIATMYPAYVNKRNDEKTMNIGVQTKYGAHVTPDILVSNVK
ncbi:MAG: hypothetical protein GXP32_01635 [Kiritimatiellaeota bacterium]|nr:hypothetical protein [Kiritimatiellota bacterium]